MFEQARREIPRADQKLQELLRCLNLKVEDLPSIQKELEDKAREIIYQRRTKKTSVDKLRRMLEGFHIQLKTVSIKVSKEAGKNSVHLILELLLQILLSNFVV